MSSRANTELAILPIIQVKIKKGEYCMGRNEAMSDSMWHDMQLCIYREPQDHLRLGESANSNRPVLFKYPDPAGQRQKHYQYIDFPCSE